MYLVIKRILDLFVACTVLLILSPLFIFIVLLLSISAENKVFYFQKRIGYKNQYFNIWKFATMLKNSPNIGTGSITLRNDPRVTFFGKYLRKSKINELPQIINVLKGDLSIVGPRPLVDQTFNAYPDITRSKIYDTKPGITGIGSIIFRDEEQLISNSNLSPHLFYETEIAPHKGALELWYQENQSFPTDLKIIVLTAWVIFFPKSNLVHSWFPLLPKRNF